MKNNIKNPTKSSPDEKKLKKIIDKLKELEEKTRNTDIFHQIANIRYLMELQNSPKGTVKFNAETGMPCSPVNKKKQRIGEKSLKELLIDQSKHWRDEWKYDSKEEDFNVFLVNKVREVIEIIEKLRC